MKSPAISVIIPAFNAEKTINRCIDSVLNQTFADFEVIIIDDGSADNTAKIVSDICKSDKRVHLYSQTNKGVSNARNTALSLAKGEYIMFVDGDDYVEPSYFLSYLETAEKNEADVVTGGCTRVNLDKSETEKLMLPQEGDITSDIWSYLAENTQLLGYCCSKIIKRDLIENNNIRYNENMYSQEDLSFNMDIYEKAKKIIAIHDAGYVYEYRQSNRVPDPVGFINNQLKLMDISNRKQVMTDQMLNKIIVRLENYCFGYLMHSENRAYAIRKLHSVDGLAAVLKYIKISNEKDFVCRMLGHSQNGMVKVYFSLREKVKKMLGRGEQ